MTRTAIGWLVIGAAVASSAWFVWWLALRAAAMVGDWLRAVTI